MDRQERERIEREEWTRQQREPLSPPTPDYVTPPELVVYHEAQEAFRRAVEAAKPKEEPPARPVGRPKKEPAPRTSPYTPMAVFEVGLPSRTEEREPEPAVWPDETQLERRQLEDDAVMAWELREKERANKDGRVMPGTSRESEALERLDELREEDEAGLAYGHPDFPGSQVPYYRRGVSAEIIQRRRSAQAHHARFGGRRPRRGSGNLAVYQPSPARAGG